MKELNVNQLENLEGGLFWGKTCGESFELEAGSCYRVCTKRRFWINFGSDVETC